MRFRDSVETNRLASVEVGDEDYRAIRHGMDKCSSCIPAHDQAPAKNVGMPDPSELQRDLQLLETYVSALRTRQKVVKESRKGS